MEHLITENDIIIKPQKFKLKSKTKAKRTAIAYGFMAPSLLLFLVFTIIPIILSFVFAFSDFNGVSGDFVGFESFIKAFNNEFFMSSIKNVFIFALFYVPLSIVTSLVMAFLISKIKIANNFFRVLYYIPSLTSGAAMIFVWKSLLSNTGGNLLAGQSALIFVIAISLWGGLGGNMLMYLAAMTGIPKDLYEAADVDGSSKFKQFLHITVPLLRPSTYFIFTTTLIGSFQLFDIVYLLGLEHNSYIITPVVEIYLMTKDYQYGVGSAMALILFVIIMLITLVTQIFVKENRDEKRLFKRIKHK